MLCIMLVYNQHKDIEECNLYLHKLLDNLITHLNKSPAVAQKITDPLKNEDLLQLSYQGEDLHSLYSDLLYIATQSTNFSSVFFAAFPDSGNEFSGIIGGITSLFLQQNLINQQYCSPLATFIDMAIIKWMREYVGYERLSSKDIHNLGGIITTGGTISNVIALLMARTQKKPESLSVGIREPSEFCIVVPADIEHYSIKSGQMWLGCGNNVLEVKTKNGRYDINDLKKVLLVNKNKVMAVVAYAGDSKTMTIEHLKKVHDVVKSIDENIWLHVDACNGFCLAFSNRLRNKLDGINLYDSIAMDPHKMMMIPYTASILLLKNPKSLRSVQTYFDLIMSGDMDLGITTPFIGSKSFISLKIWSMMKSYGKQGLSDYVEDRYKKAQYFKKKLLETKKFKVLNSVDAFAVVFIYYPSVNIEIETINRININLHNSLLKKHKLLLHCFMYKDKSGVVYLNKVLNALRFFSGNPGVTYRDIDVFVGFLVEEATLIIENNK